MSVESKKEILKLLKQRKYLNKDFDGLKADLLEYAKTYFPNNIKDFSETSLAGMMLELAAYVGDVDSFYLDHQFHELNPETAVENKNIESMLRRASVPIVGASPAVLTQTFLIEVPTTGNPPVPNTVALPIFHEGSIVTADNGTQFELVEDLDFAEKDISDEYIAKITIGNVDSAGRPTSFIMSRTGLCISGFRTTETFSVGSFEAFKEYTLARENVTDIISVTDSFGNDYYQVDHLTDDTIFKAVVNRNPNDSKIVKDKLFMIPAPYRFVSKMALQTRLTTLTFGGGSAQSLDDDIIPDPSEFAIPLYGKRTFSRFTINPANLLRTTTLGIIAPNSTITITYRYGGGLSHNIGPETIRGVTTLKMSFPNGPTADIAQAVRSSVDSINYSTASGGEDAPTVEELKTRIPSIMASQNRIVTKEDLIARIYTMPSNFGRVFRVSVAPDPNNSLSTRIFIVSRDANNRLTLSPDSLKENLSTYLNKFRMSNDALDILDARIINLQINFSIVADPNFGNKNLIKQNIISKLKKYFAIKNFEIDQPIMLNDVENIIFNNPGVLSIADLKIENISGVVNSTVDGAEARVYSTEQYDIKTNTERKIIFPPTGGIFELRFPDFDVRAIIL